MKAHALASLIGLVALVGCTNSLKLKVVDIDDGYKPIAGASVARFQTPRHKGDAWPTTPSETQTTGADGSTTFGRGVGRFVVTAPGKSSASFYSSFAPTSAEIGLGAAAK